MSKHTGKTWSRNIPPASHYPIIFADRNTHVAQVISRGLSTEEVEANANLIAAAPDLLAALKAAMVWATDDDGNVWAESTIKRCEAAIARAEGVKP